MARATITGNKPILDSVTNGYGLSLNAQTPVTSSNFTTNWVDTGGADSKASPFGKGLGRYNVGILGYTMEDTDSNNTSDKVTLYF